MEGAAIMKIINRLVGLFSTSAEGDVPNDTEIPNYIQERAELTRQIRNGDVGVNPNQKGAGYFASRANKPDRV